MEKTVIAFTAQEMNKDVFAHLQRMADDTTKVYQAMAEIDKPMTASEIAKALDWKGIHYDGKPYYEYQRVTHAVKRLMYRNLAKREEVQVGESKFTSHEYCPSRNIQDAIRTMETLGLDTSALEKIAEKKSDWKEVEHTEPVYKVYFSLV